MNTLKLWQKTFRGNLCLLANYAHANRVRIRVTSYSRSRAAQARLVEFPQGYPGRFPQGYPVAAPGRSQHQYGLAVDLSATPKTALPALGSIWNQMGGYWSAADPVHFAFFNPSQWATLLATCGPRKRSQNVINPYGPINAPTIGFPPGGINIPIPPELPPSYPSPPILPNVATAVTSVASSPLATTMVGSTASRGVVTIQTPVGPAVMVSAPVSTSVVPSTTSRR